MKRVIGMLFALAFAALAAGDAAHELSRKALELYRQAHYAEAEPLFRQAIEAWNTLTREGERNRAIDERRLGSLLEMTGRYSEAEEWLTGALRELEATGAPGMETVYALSFLSAGRRARGDLAGAASFASRAVEFAESREDVSAVERLSLRALLGSVYLSQGRREEAKRLLKSVLDGGDAVTVMSAETNLAIIALANGEPEQAEAYARYALRLALLSLPANDPGAAIVWHNLAQVLRFRQQYAEAEKAYRRAIEIWQRALGPAHPDVAKGLLNLAALYRECGREAEAEDLYRRAARIAAPDARPVSGFSGGQ